jgi:arabinofuranan 3-O-arabinosyltransferase
VVGASLDACHYSYPPVLLLLTTPLALMAHVPALLAWLAAGWYAFYRALRRAMPGQGALLSRWRFSSTRSADRTAPGRRRCSVAA